MEKPSDQQALSRAAKVTSTVKSLTMMHCTRGSSQEPRAQSQRENMPAVPVEGHCVKYGTRTPKTYRGDHEQGESEKLPQPGGARRRKDQMPCGVLDGVLGQGKDTGNS